MRKWHKDMTDKELTERLVVNFVIKHDYNLPWVPNPITREWLIDQLMALDHYVSVPSDDIAPVVTKPKSTRKPSGPKPIGTAKGSAKTPKPRPKRSKPEEYNPFR